MIVIGKKTSITFTLSLTNPLNGYSKSVVYCFDPEIRFRLIKVPV